MIISDSNPVQFWLTGKPTFNEQTINYVRKNCFFSLWETNDKFRVDIIGDVGMVSKLVGYYQDGSLWHSFDFVNIGGTLHYYVSFAWSDYPEVKDKLIQFKINNTEVFPNGDFETMTLDQWSQPVDGWEQSWVAGSVDTPIGTFEEITNPSFASTLSPWIGNYANGIAGISGQDWNWDSFGGGAAKAVVASGNISTFGVKQDIEQVSDNRTIRVQGTINCSSYPSAVHVYINFYRSDGFYLGQQDLFNTSANNNFDVTISYTDANLAKVAIYISNNSGGVVTSATLYIEQVNITRVTYSHDYSAGMNFSLTGAPLGVHRTRSLRHIYTQVSTAAKIFNYKVVSRPNNHTVGAWVSAKLTAIYYKDGVEIATQLVQLMASNTTYTGTFVTAAGADFDTIGMCIIYECSGAIFFSGGWRIDVCDFEPQTLGTGEFARTDHMSIKDDQGATELIRYTNIKDFDNKEFKNSLAIFDIRIPASFWVQDNPTTTEDHTLSNGAIVSLRNEIKEKQWFQTDMMPNYMHLKFQKILMHDIIRIQDFIWKKEAEDQYTTKPLIRYGLKQSTIWLTKKEIVLVNIGGDTGTSSIPGPTLARIFDDSFDDSFE